MQSPYGSKSLFLLNYSALKGSASYNCLLYQNTAQKRGIELLEWRISYCSSATTTVALVYLKPYCTIQILNTLWPDVVHSRWPHPRIMLFSFSVVSFQMFWCQKLSVCCVTGCMGSNRFSVLGTSFGSEPKPPWKTYPVLRWSGWISGNVFGRDHVRDWRCVRPM